MPGPLFVVTLAAGLSGGAITGMLVGLGAALAASAMSGTPLMSIAIACLGAGALVSLLPRWLSARHLLVGITAAFLASALYASILACFAHQALMEVGLFALRRGGVNALWMFAIYSIVLVLYPRPAPRVEWEQ